MMKPTSPADNSSRARDLGVKTPTCSTKWVAPVAISRILSFGRTHAVEDADQHDHANVVVEPRIDDQCLQRRLGVAPRNGAPAR